MTCPFTHDDGAYVLGSLSPADRAAFESHLSDCSPCREGVASLAVLPGLLGRLSPAAAAEVATAGRAPVSVPPELLPRVLSAARRRQRRNRHRWALVAAAAVLAVLVGLGVHLLDDGPTGGPPQAGGPTAIPSVLPTPPVSLRPMTPVSSSIPVVAELGLRPTPEGTRVEMSCGYIKQQKYSDRTWTLHLYVWPMSGAPERIATWTAKGGDEMRVSATTRYAPAQILRVEVQGGSGRTLLTWSPP